jgi:hypothetical protein
MNQKQWPATVDEAVGVVIATLSDEERTSIAALAQTELSGLHMSLGAWIRSNLGLWKGNRPLLESTAEQRAVAPASYLGYSQSRQDLRASSFSLGEFALQRVRDFEGSATPFTKHRTRRWRE